MLPLEKQVCSLEYAKKLKELGVNQQSLFYWYERNAPGKPKDSLVSLGLTNGPNGWSCDTFSAFTVAELGVMLPDFREENSKIEENHYALTITKISGNFIVFDKGFDDKNESDLRAQALIYAIQKNVITVSEINERI